MSNLETYQVYPKVPEALSFMETLSQNLWWSWNLSAIELFRRISPKLWRESNRNPIVFSTLIPQKRLHDLAEDEGFLAHMKQVEEKFNRDIRDKSSEVSSKYKKGDTVAYFSMEFGIHESLPLFAGGLGVLAGDHLKAASDLGIPLVGVGLLYQSGYFHQYLNHEGWQQEEFPRTDIFHLPVVRAVDPSGNEVIIEIDGPGGIIKAAVWKIGIGRVPLYLLDTNLTINPPEIRLITSKLYSAESEIRLAQEIVLGIGGMRALEALNILPTVCHMNEGHCAFAGIERVSQIMRKSQIDLKTAQAIVARSTVFTTHTPVSAGHDEFPADSVQPYLASFTEKLGLSIEELISWGQPAGSDANGKVSMFVLGLRMTEYCNGVSELHGKVARQMWSHVWPGRPVDEIPINHVTNGIHVPSWLSFENTQLLERYIGPDWQLRCSDPEAVARIDEIYDEELWRAHTMCRSRLIRTCRARMVKQYARRNAPKSLMDEVENVLDHDVLTIGFARRFATYKRATLLLKDPSRFEALLSSEKYPIQLVFAGKAHPRDEEGKKLIQNLIQFANNSGFRHKIVFLEDYDINIARHMIQGADVWLNTPRRPLEACGTSGMKAAVNGVLNLSVLDGWWCEGYNEDRGWRIGNGEEYKDYDYQDSVESQALYNILENDILPCFYDRKEPDTPEIWVKMMKESMKMVMNDFCSHGMVETYSSRFYLPATKRFQELSADGSTEATRLAHQLERFYAVWNKIQVERPRRDTNGPFWVGESFGVSAVIHLGELTPEEVAVELYYGQLESLETLTASNVQSMEVKEDNGNGQFVYGCQLVCQGSGRFGFTVRVIPKGDSEIVFSPGLITWA